MQRARRRRSCDAGDCAEIFVDSPQVMVRQVSKTRPRHCLEKVSVEWSGDAAGVNDRTGRPCCAGRVQVIQVHARPHDLNKLPKRAASFGQAGFIGCQVAGDDDRRAWHRCTKNSAATHVRGLIDDRRLAKVWIISWHELSDRRASAMALIAGDGCVDDIAAQADEGAVFAHEVEGDRCDIESPLNPGVVAVVIVIAGSFDAWGSVQHGREKDGGEGCGGGCGLQ